MYNVERSIKKFNTDEESDMSEYDAILNNPLCTIVSERKEKLSDRDMDSEGGVVSIREYVILVVTWEEKVLAV